MVDEEKEAVTMKNSKLPRLAARLGIYCLGLWILGDFCLPTYFGQLAMLASSVVLIGVSLVLYIDAQLVPMPAEGLVGCVAEKTGKPFSTMKVAFDCSSVLAGALLSLLFLGKLVGIREGTVITAILAGRLMGRFRKWLTPVIRKVGFGE